MLAITPVLVVGTFVLLAALVIGIVAFVGLIVYDALAGGAATPLRADEQRAYAPAPARAA